MNCVARIVAVGVVVDVIGRRELADAYRDPVHIPHAGHLVRSVLDTFVFAVQAPGLANEQASDVRGWLHGPHARGLTVREAGNAVHVTEARPPEISGSKTKIRTFPQPRRHKHGGRLGGGRWLVGEQAMRANVRGWKVIMQLRDHGALAMHAVPGLSGFLLLVLVGIEDGRLVGRLVFLVVLGLSGGDAALAGAGRELAGFAACPAGLAAGSLAGLAGQGG